MRGLLQVGPDIGVGGEVPGDDQHGGDQDHLERSRPRAAEAVSTLFCGHRRQHRGQHREQDQRQSAQGRERRAPPRVRGDQRRRGDAEHRRHRHPAQDDRGGPADRLLGHQACAQTGGEGPEAADAHAGQHPGGQHDGEARSERARQIGRRQQRHQAEQRDSPVEAAGAQGDHGGGDGGDQSGKGDHQPGGAVGDLQGGGDRGQQPDGQHLAGDDGEGAHGDGGDGRPARPDHGRDDVYGHAPQPCDRHFPEQ